MSIPVFGNGDIWEAADALAMMAQTGCDGVVIGRGCLGRPWFFADLAAAFTGAAIDGPRTFAAVVPAILDHADRLVERLGEQQGVKVFRKHALWYLGGFAVGGDARARAARLASRDELATLLLSIDGFLVERPGQDRTPKRKRRRQKRVALPAGFLEAPDDGRPLAAAAGAVTSGG